MATIDAVATEITAVATFLVDQARIMDPAAMAGITAGMVNTLKTQTSALKAIPAASVTILTRAIEAAKFDRELTLDLMRCVQHKMLSGPLLQPAQHAPQKFATPEEAANFYTEQDWAVLDNPSLSKSHKIAVVVRWLSRMGFASPDQMAKCDVGAVICHAHWHAVAIPTTLCELANDVKAGFARAPPPPAGTRILCCVPQLRGSARGNQGARL